MSKIPVQFELNGKPCAEMVDAHETLLTVLRARLDVTSVKQGCAQGTCGCCTVVVDGEPRLACLTLAGTCEGARVETVESLGTGADLHPLQRSFMEHFATQCGFCTTGMLMASKSLLDMNPTPTRDEVIEAIAGNICRCTGYEPLVDAVLAAAASSTARSR